MKDEIKDKIGSLLIIIGLLLSIIPVLIIAFLAHWTVGIILVGIFSMLAGMAISD